MSSTQFTLRWFVNTRLWAPSADEFAFFLALLPPDERGAVQRFMQHDDRKRALVSRLLQRACVRQACGIADPQVRILRTKGKKPFTTNERPAGAPNFNFNVSHEGDYTALASEPFCVCGVDVSAPQQLRKSKELSLHKAIDSFKEQFAASEWSLIQSFAHEEGQMEMCFQRLWSLKEAYVKARGDGLGFEPLSRAEFTFLEGEWGRHASLKVDGVEQLRWSFELQSLEGGHWVSVARGPPEDVVDAFGVFKSTFNQFYMSGEELKAHLHADSPPFEQLFLKDLVPAQSIDSYLALMKQESDTWG